ncbi:MAG: bifunctional diaminohydroxyphosphoribosylaminopyrimidine deaminase/5-amino-6-(5-phosphoribosylamino)uracil reductase RibD [Chitinophagales bacterium]
MGIDEHYMQRCLELAIQGLGSVAPNPMVGCVIVHNGRIIGEGYHKKYGEAHAEVNAINSVEDKSLLQSSTMYVSLEPCSHFGKTPPCADLIVKHKIPQVVIGSADPNPLVAGKGVAKLKAAGIKIKEDVLKKECDFVNRRFVTFFTKKRPYIILKWAESADGFIAPVEEKQVWLTNEQSKKLVHKWRSEEQAVLVGSNTARIDDPELTVRLWEGQNPVRLVVDRTLSLNPALKVFNQAAQTIVFNQLEDSLTANIERVKIDFSENVEQQLLSALYARNISSVLIEGGAALLNSFITANLWDEARIFKTTAKLGSGKKVNAINGKLLSETEIENDRLTIVQNN